MDIIVHDVQLVKNSCELNRDSQASDLREIGLEFNVLRFEDLEDGKTEIVFLFLQSGYYGEKRKELFSIESQFRSVLGIKPYTPPKNLSEEDAKKAVIGKVYPFVRTHHMQIMALMGIRAILPWDLPQNIQYRKTTSEKPKERKKTSPKKTKKNQ